MQKTILETTETQTPDTKILCDTFSGTYQLLCTVYADSPVTLQIREPRAEMWRDCVFAGKAIRFEKVGEVVDVPVIPCYAYRCVTETAGAEVVAFAE